MLAIVSTNSDVSEKEMYFHFSTGSVFHNDYAFEGEEIKLFCGISFHSNVELVKTELILYDSSNVKIFGKEDFVKNRPYGIEFGPTYMVNKSGIVAYACVWIVTIYYGEVIITNYEHKLIAIPTCSLLN